MKRQLSPRGLYIGGFALCLLLTLEAYGLTVTHALGRSTLMLVLAALALVQFGVQLVFFLHLGLDEKPGWKFWPFVFMAVIVVILVGGSIWIMDNLNYQMLSPAQLQTQLHNNEGL